MLEAIVTRAVLITAFIWTLLSTGCLAHPKKDDTRRDGMSSESVIRESTATSFNGDSLPRPNDIVVPSTPPWGWKAKYGGVGLPSFKSGFDAGAPATGAPAIGFQTDSTFPGETIAIIGERLSGADFVLWAEGGAMPIQPLRTANDRAQIVVPEVFAGAQVKKSVMLLWPHNANGYGAAVPINTPTIFWVSPGKKFINDLDRTIRIFGKNLAIPGVKTHVIARLRFSEFAGPHLPFELQVISASPNEIRANPPTGFITGTYSIQVHNGTGGDYGWSQVASFTAALNKYSIGTQFPVDTQPVPVDTKPGEIDQAKIKSAIAAASKNGGGTVVFSPRVYTITENTSVPGLALVHPPIVLKGAGRGRTLIRSSPDRVLEIAGAGSSVTDMTLEGVQIAVLNEDVTISNIEASANDSVLYNWANKIDGTVHSRQKINLKVTDSVFRAVGSPVTLYQASNIHFKRCEFIGRYHDGILKDNVKYDNLGNNGIRFYVTHNVIVEDSLFRSEDPLGGKILTRGLTMLHNSDSNHVYMNNRFEWIGAFPSAANRDTNSGEVILFHGVDSGLISTVTSSDLGSVTVARTTTEFINNPSDFGTFSGGRAMEFRLLKVIVISGRAAGQIKTLVSATPAGSGLTRLGLGIENWQHITPEPGDQILVRAMFNQHIIKDNYLDSVPDPQATVVDFNRAGIMFFSATHDSIVTGNTLKHMAGGIVLIAGGGINIHGSNEIRGNTITNSITGGPFPGYAKCMGDMGGNFGISGPEFISFGNRFRDNTCKDSEAGFAVGIPDHDRIFDSFDRNQYAVGPSVGIVHTIVENNIISNITGSDARPNLGIAVTAASNWSLFRNNQMDWESNIDFFLPEKVYESLLIER